MKKCLWAFCALALPLAAQNAGQAPKPAPTVPPSTAPTTQAPSQTTTQSSTTQAPAQTPQAGQPARSVTVDPQPPSYVRRFSAGVTLEYLPLALTKGGQVQQTQTLGPVEINSDSKAYHSKQFGGGIVMQIAVTDRWAVAINGLWRQTGYEMKNTTYVGTTRKQTITNEKTTVTFIDFPVQVRRYNKERSEPGWRWFYEAGGTFRYMNKISTSIETTHNGETTCCTSGPALISSKNVPGATGGIGLQFNDDFGIRIVPEVRYTWWLGRTFDNLATRSNRQQVDVMVSFTF